MKRIALALLATALLAAPAAAETQRFNLAGFSAVEASSHVRVILRQGPYSVVAEEPNGRFGDLILEVRGGTLVASRKPQRNWGWTGRNGPEYTVTVSAPNIREIRASSHGSVNGAVAADALRLKASSHGRITGAFTARAVDISATSHGALRGEVTADRLDVRASSHGHVRYTGRCQDLTVDVSSHGGVSGEDMTCATARAVASSHGGASVNASRSADGRATSHGHLTIHGAPPVYAASASSHGSVRRF